MTKSKNNNNMGWRQYCEEINPVQDYLSKLFLYLHNETGITKQSFTKRGLQNYVKNIAKKCFQLQNIAALFKIASIFCKFVNGDIETAIDEFVMILHQIVNFLAKYYLGQCLLAITVDTMSEGMTAFLICFYHIAMFVIERFSFACFLRIKDWIVMLFKSKNIKHFFEEVFPTYGRTLTMA